jgi:hypothetical protein
MGLFEYDPLDLDDCSFRLIRLFKADYGLVQCELFQSWLHNKDCAVEYEALSYTWGNTNNLYEIEVNGKKLPVTGNLFLALQQLRFKHQDRILWIDAICIDQSNFKERGHQVRQMSSIYTKAAQVIVWLGQATSDTDLFFHYMQCLEKEALNYACTDWKSSDERWQHIWSDVRILWNNLHEEAQREGLKEVLRRPWFRRVWILQEVANARSAKIMCGEKSVSARIFTVAPTILGITPDSHCQAVLDIMPGASRRYSWWSGDRHLRTLLSKFKECKATDPRDRIYALLGMSSDGCRTALLTPDYDKSEMDVIQDTVIFLLHLHERRDCMASMPKWGCSEFIENLMSLEGIVLQCAAEKADHVVARMMMNTGNVQPDIRGQYEQDSLLRAARFGDYVVVEHLLKISNLNVNWKHKYGETSLTTAAEYGNTPVVQVILNTGKANVNLGNKLSQTPLSLAARNGHEAVVKLLLKMNTVEVERGDDYRWTPLHQAASKGHKAVVKLLLETGKVNVDLKDQRGYTSISRAAEGGHKQVVELLLRMGQADADLADDSGQTPLSHAAKNGYQSVVDLLETSQEQLGQRGAYERVGFSWAAWKKSAFQKLSGYRQD